MSRINKYSFFLCLLPYVKGCPRNSKVLYYFPCDFKSYSARLNMSFIAYLLSFLNILFILYCFKWDEPWYDETCVEI